MVSDSFKHHGILLAVGELYEKALCFTREEKFESWRRIKFNFIIKMYYLFDTEISYLGIISASTLRMKQSSNQCRCVKEFRYSRGVTGISYLGIISPSTLKMKQSSNQCQCVRE